MALAFCVHRDVHIIFAKKLLAFIEQTLIFQPSQFGNGLVAQLVERLNGIEEVVSSILIESTKLAG